MRTVPLPSSKSVTLRTLLLASVANGISILEGVTLCDDVRALLSNFAHLGVTYTHDNDRITVEGRRWQQTPELYCGESGFLARTLPFFSAVQGGTGNVHGEGSLLRRKLDDLTSVFCAAGGTCDSWTGLLPVHYTPLTLKDEIWVGAQDSSQSLSGLLMTVPLSNARKRIKFSTSASVGYIWTTLSVMRAFGAVFEVYTCIESTTIDFLPCGYHAWGERIEADWSAAAQIIATAQIGETICLQGLYADSLQPDRAVLSVLESIGWEHNWIEGNLVITPRYPTRPFTFDATQTPDLFPALAALATQADGESAIRGIHRLHNKESDRATALTTMLGSYGIPCSIQNDVLYIKGGSFTTEGRPKSRGIVPTFHDHRIAMSAAAIGLRCVSPPELDDMTCVGKSFPRFFDHLPELIPTLPSDLS